MILRAARSVNVSDPEGYAWGNLRKFQNVDLVEETIVSLHSSAGVTKSNARKQARQLRYCLIQAREYFSAAKTVSLATKPTLQYYGIMSLALAEILLKQTGDSSLDKARQDHRHHGLLFKDQARKTEDNSLGVSADSLRAIPHADSGGERKGTFELWHRSCREMPVTGTRHDSHEENVRTQGCSVILGARDERLNPVPGKGMSLLDCLRSSPGMAEHLSFLGVQPLVLRATVETHISRQRATMRIFVHPSNLTSAFFGNFLFEPSWWDRISLREAPHGGGGILEWSMEPIPGTADFTGPKFEMPHCSPWRHEEVRLWPANQPLNEFGYLYVALFIAGNYARYFPDRWLKDVESSTPLAVAIEALTELAEWRAPWLCLCELSRVCFVLQA